MEILFPQILFQIVNFGIIVAVLYKFLYKPILKILDQRSQKVSQGLQAAEANLKAQEELDDKVKSEIKQAQSEASKVVKSAKTDAEKQAQEILAKAREQAGAIVAKERASMEASFSQEKKQMEADFAAMVTQTTKELLATYLTDSEQKKIIDHQIKDLKNYHFQA